MASSRETLALSLASDAAVNHLLPACVESLPVQETKSAKSPDSSAIDGFEEALKSLQSRDQEQKNMPANLPGGVLLDQHYLISSRELNLLLFAPNSKCMHAFLELQKATEIAEGPWQFEDELKRVITFTKPGTFLKSMKVITDHIYLKADERSYAVLEIINTPDVPFGSSFRIEVLFRVTPGPELPSGKETSLLVISWRVNFVESTIISGMVEGGARQGLKEQYDMFSRLLAETVDPLHLEEAGLNKSGQLENGK